MTVISVKHTELLLSRRSLVASLLKLQLLIEKRAGWNLARLSSGESTQEQPVTLPKKIKNPSPGKPMHCWKRVLLVLNSRWRRASFLQVNAVKICHVQISWLMANCWALSISCGVCETSVSNFLQWFCCGVTGLCRLWSMATRVLWFNSNWGVQMPEKINFQSHYWGVSVR